MKTLIKFVVLAFIVIGCRSALGCNCYPACTGCLKCEGGVCVVGDCSGDCETCVKETNYYGSCQCLASCCYHGSCLEGGPCTRCDVSNCECVDDDSKCTLPCEICIDGYCKSACDEDQFCRDDVCVDCGACEINEGGVCTYQCSGCQKCDGDNCVDKCGDCQNCNASEECEDNCEDCERCVEGSCNQCGTNQRCEGGVCIDNCGDCQHYEGGVCVGGCSDCQTCVDGECQEKCPDCQVCKDGVCTGQCGDCEKCVNDECVSRCGDCQKCYNGDCVSICEDCERCIDGACVGCDGDCQTCQNGICVDNCYGCQHCEGGTCVFGCGPCKDCIDGSCVESCLSSECMTCKNGNCGSICGDCEHCENGVCVSDCSDCEKCVNGRCENQCGDCLTCNQGNCVEKCTGCLSCEEGDCIDTCSECTHCDGVNCIPGCPEHFTCNQSKSCECTGTPYYSQDTVITTPVINGPDSACPSYSVTLTASASDSDKYNRCENNRWIVSSQSDGLSYTWADNTGRPISSAFLNGINTGETVNWIAPSSPSIVEITVIADDSGTKFNDSSVNKFKNIEVKNPQVVSVVWETISDNTPIDNNPGGGKRIFPDKMNYEENNEQTIQQRKQVLVKATIEPACSGKYVYFKWWDVDDPCASTVIDTFDLPEGPSGPDNYGGSGGVGFLLGSGSIVLKTFQMTTGDGTATRIFVVGMNPGDNFKIAASLNSTSINTLTQQQADNLQALPNDVILSEPLTVWRKLWIENDSMGMVATTGSEKNLVTGTATSYESYRPPPYNTTVINIGQNLPDAFDDENQFWNGTYISGGISYYTRTSTAYMYDYDQVKIFGDPAGDGVPPGPYELYDDDDNNLLPSYPNLGIWSTKFKSSYIQIFFLQDDYRNQVTYKRNLSIDEVSNGSGDWNDQHNCLNTENCWVVFMCSAFQPETTADGDPDGERPTICGATRWVGWPIDSPHSSKEFVIYLETRRDLNTFQLGQAIAHEIGHTGGSKDGEQCGQTCIMKPNAGGSVGNIFCDYCIKKYRTDSNW